MHPLLPLLALTLLAACAGTGPAAAPDIRAVQEAACTAAIAAHVGRPAAEVTSRWIGDATGGSAAGGRAAGGSAAGGGATVEAIDGNRRHLCQVDASGRVQGYSHPR